MELATLGLTLNSVLNVRVWSVAVGGEKKNGGGTYTSYAMSSMDII